MNTLTVSPTKITPAVFLDPDSHRIEFKGESFPENSFEFYKPIIQWVQEYFQTSDDGAVCTVIFKISYLNTSSTKIFLMILDILEEAYSRGRKIEISWCYDQDDIMSKELGEDFSEGLKMPFQFKEV